MSTSKYRAFIQVVETGSLTKAAKALGYSQPGISHMMDSLESDMGFPLLIRNKDRILPTEDGKRVLYYCYQIIKNENYLRETVSSIHGVLEGDIRLGAYCSLMSEFVPRAVQNFTGVYSNIRFYLQEVEHGNFQNLLSQGVLDLAFMNEFVPKGFHFIPLFHDKSVVIMRQDHPFVSYETLTPSMLNGCDFIMPMEGYNDVIAAVQQKSPFSPNIRFYTASDACAIAMVSEGLGISIVSSLQVKLLPAGLVVKEFEGNYGRKLGIAIKSLKHMSPAIREFVRIAKNTAMKMGQEHIVT